MRLTVQRDVTSINFNKDVALPLDAIEAGDQRNVGWLESVTEWVGMWCLCRKDTGGPRRWRACASGPAGSAGEIHLGVNISPRLSSELRGSYAYLDQEKKNQWDYHQKVPICPPSSSKGLLQTRSMTDDKLAHQSCIP